MLARLLTSWVRGPDHEHPAGTVTVDLVTGAAVWTRAEHEPPGAR